MQAAKKYGTPAVIGAVIGLGLAVLDPFKINDPNSKLGAKAPDWLVKVYGSSWQMALAGAVIGILLFLLYELVMKRKSPMESYFGGEAYTDLLPSDYYSSVPRHSPVAFDNAVPIG